MRVQKIIRAQGEYAKVGQDLKDGIIIKILDVGQIVSGDYGDRHVFKVATSDWNKNLTFNQTSMNNLIDEFGDDTAKWIGQEIKVWLITQSISGQMKRVCYLTGKNWDMVDDGKGNLRFARFAQNDARNESSQESDPRAEDISF